jgi:hypothetical protein
MLHCVVPTVLKDHGKFIYKVKLSKKKKKLPHPQDEYIMSLKTFSNTHTKRVTLRKLKISDY